MTSVGALSAGTDRRYAWWEETRRETLSCHPQLLPQELEEPSPLQVQKAPFYLADCNLRGENWRWKTETWKTGARIHISLKINLRSKIGAAPHPGSGWQTAVRRGMGGGVAL